MFGGEILMGKLMSLVALDMGCPSPGEARRQPPQPQAVERGRENGTAASGHPLNSSRVLHPCAGAAPGAGLTGGQHQRVRSSRGHPVC